MNDIQIIQKSIGDELEELLTQPIGNELEKMLTQQLTDSINKDIFKKLMDIGEAEEEKVREKKRKERLSIIEEILKEEDSK